MRKILMSLILALSALGTQAQVTAELQVFASLGTFTSSGTFSVSATMGESIVNSVTSGNLITLQGFQQPLSGGMVSIDAPLAPFSLTVFPNPVQNQLSIDLSGRLEQPIRLQLFDASGRSISDWDFELSQPGFTQRSTEQLATGMYFLRVSQLDGKYASTMPIIR
jgi:hypothetical protein